MPEFIIEADGYSFEFNGRNSFTYQNIRLNPIDDYYEIIIRAKRERVHYKTCIAEVYIGDAVDHQNAIEKSEKILDELAFYLAFGFGHDVFFQDFNCYKSEGSSKEFIGSKQRSMHVGKMIGGANIYPQGIQNFLDRGFDKFLSEDFNEKTGIRRAILWYNLGLDYNILEVSFAFHFIALEILAACFAKENPIEPRLSDKIYPQFKSKLMDLYQELDIADWKNIHNRICGEIQRTSIKDKISALLQCDLCNIGQYESVAHGFVDLRNKIFHEGHGDIACEYGGWATILRQIDRLLVKLILKILNCYDMEGLHTSITRDDLLARV